MIMKNSRLRMLVRGREKQTEGIGSDRKRRARRGTEESGKNARTHALAQKPEESRWKEDDTFDDDSMQ